MTGQTVNVLEKLAESWGRRASVRVGPLSFDDEAAYDPSIPDYPLELVPFRAHPRFTSCSAEQRSRALTLAWLAYNRRTITGEEWIARPAFEMLSRGHFPGTQQPAIAQTMIQSVVDEDHHILLHTLVMQQTIRRRHLEGLGFTFPAPITCRALERHRQGLTEPWQRDVLQLVFATVAEVTVNPYLNLLAEAQGVQPANTFVAKLHSQDEYRHGRILVHAVRPIYEAMNDAQREFFIRSLPKGLDAFGAHDFSTWTAILQHVGVDHAEGIISDCIAAGPGRLVRDWSALVQLGRELGIAERVAELEPLDRAVSNGPVSRVADV